MLHAGQIIAGRYRLEGTLEEGGMASVWKATHVDLGHAVAVKFNTVRGPGATAAADRFLREARVAAAIRHRHVIDMIDFGLTDSGVPFIVMEFLDGMDLGDRLGILPSLSVRDFLEIVSATLRGLSAVHEAGVVHRDVKPENIFLVGDADGHFPKLLDFGISRATPRASGLRSSVPTIEGILVGTPEYMSPEQARGLKDVDFRTDLYSMGAVTYEGLSGRLPFEAEAVGDLLIQITTGTKTPLSHHRPDLGPELSDWVERAMARDRGERFEDARSMRKALLEAIETRARQQPDWDTLRVSRPGSGPMASPGESSAPTLGPEDAIDSAEPRIRLPSSMSTLDSWDGVPAAQLEPRGRSRRIWVGALVASLGLAALAYASQSSGGAEDEPNVAAPVAPVFDVTPAPDGSVPATESAVSPAEVAAPAESEDAGATSTEQTSAHTSAQPAPRRRRHRPRGSTPSGTPSSHGRRPERASPMRGHASPVHMVAPFADPGF